eukprot:9236773-Pyramimonas_sp.AAC.1
MRNTPRLRAPGEAQSIGACVNTWDWSHSGGLLMPPAPRPSWGLLPGPSWGLLGPPGASWGLLRPPVAS